MARFPFNVVGFDLDGTLVDSSGDLAAAVNVALAEAGCAPMPAARLRPLIGGGSAKMLERALAVQGVAVGETALAALNARLIAHYAEHIAEETRPYPGCLAALDALTAEGVALAVVTNKKEWLARRLLDALGMSARFAAIVGGDTLLGKAKPDPDPLVHAFVRCGGGAAAFVGDSRFDVEAAQAAGVPVVAYSGGFSEVPVAELGADAVIADYAELVPALSALR